MVMVKSFNVCSLFLTSNTATMVPLPKLRLRRHYSQNKDLAVKTRINQLQKQVKEELKIESLVSWEKFCNSISLESNSNESWRKIKNFLKPRGQRDYPTLHHANKVAKTNCMENSHPQYVTEA